MRFRLHILMMSKLPMYNMLFAGVEWYDNNYPQPLDPWRGCPLMRRSREKMMRF